MERDWPFRAAFLVALLLHISALTLFSIVVRFHRSHIQYNTLSLVNLKALPLPAATDTGPLVLSVTPHPPKSSLPGLASVETPGSWRLHSGVDLPEFELGAVRSLQLRGLGKDLHVAETPRAPVMPRDSWALFSGALQSVGQDLGTRLFGAGGVGKLWAPALSSGIPGEPAAQEVIRLGTVAEGVEGTITWISEPRTRRLVSASLVHFTPRAGLPGGRFPTLTKPISLVFRVTPDGRVTDVVHPIEDSGGLVDAVASALKRYRFESLPAGANQEEQAGTLRLTPVTPQRTP